MENIKNFGWNGVAKAVNQAQALIRRAESEKTEIAKFLRGRLRGIDTEVLTSLKRELKDFNAQTGEWK